jgi:hypothetical protein
LFSDAPNINLFNLEKGRFPNILHRLSFKVVFWVRNHVSNSATNMKSRSDSKIYTTQQ